MKTTDGTIHQETPPLLWGLDQNYYLARRRGGILHNYLKGCLWVENPRQPAEQVSLGEYWTLDVRWLDRHQRAARQFSTEWEFSLN